MSAIPLRRIEGKYEILGKLREGGMGAIYKVRHRLLDEVRVIKVMRPQLIEDEELKARFLREARLAIKLRHPNIAQLYDFTVDEEDGAFIVMEFIDGKTLEDLVVGSRPHPLGLTLEIAQQSLRALGYLHAKGFLHRDISPDNLMVTEDADGQPLVKLIDLGIAKILGGAGDGLTQTGTFLGKVRYASPEQFGVDGASSADGRGDLYSFGIVLYELLTGRYPITGRDPSSLIAGHLFRPPLDFQESDPEGRVPPGLREIVLKSLEKKAEERFASAQEFSKALAGFRLPGDISDLDLRRALSRAAAASSVSLVPPGSTQERLDERFGLENTPSRGRMDGPEGLAQIAETIELHLEKGELSVAEVDIRQAVGAYGERPELRTLRDRLDDLREREVMARVDELLQNARELSAAQRFEESLVPLTEARTLAPGNPETGELAAEIEAARERHAEERRREAAAVVATIEADLARGDLRAAEERLEEAVAAHGEQAAFAPLHRRLEEQKRREEEERARQAEQKRLAEEKARQAEQKRREEEKARQAEQKRREEESARQAEQKRREEEKARQAEQKRREEESARQAELKRREEEKARQAELKRREEEKARKAEQKRREEERARSAPASEPAPGRRLWIGAAALALLIVVGAVWFFTRGKPAVPETADNAPPSAQPSPPAALVTGTLILDAVPWGEVVEIVDAHGQRQTLGAQKYTPFVMALPPGHYTVTVRHPDVPQPVRIEAEVLSGATVRSFAQLKPMTEEELFHALGW